MFPNMDKYYEMKRGNFPYEEVSEEEFIKLLLADGSTEEQAKNTLMVAKVLESYVHIGDKMIKIKKEE